MCNHDLFKAEGWICHCNWKLAHALYLTEVQCSSKRIHQTDIEFLQKWHKYCSTYRSADWQPIKTQKPTPLSCSNNVVVVTIRFLVGVIVYFFRLKGKLKQYTSCHFYYKAIYQYSQYSTFTWKWMHKDDSRGTSYVFFVVTLLIFSWHLHKNV